MSIVETKFTKICDGLPGSEGPVFDAKGVFYAVSPMGSRYIPIAYLQFMKKRIRVVSQRN